MLRRGGAARRPGSTRPSAASTPSSSAPATSIRSRRGEEGRLVGGLYGVKLGAAFFGESMFSTARDASKVALVHLVTRLRRGGFKLLDAQFLTSHLVQFGAVEVPRDDYVRLLDAALAIEAVFSEHDPEEVDTGFRTRSCSNEERELPFLIQSKWQL